MVVEEVFSVIAEGTRRDILASLAKEHKAVGALVEELGVSQPTVSKHLKVLRDAGLVTMRAQGQKRFYSINTAPLVLVSQWLQGLGAGPEGAVKATTKAAAVISTVDADAVSVPRVASVTVLATEVNAPLRSAEFSPAAAASAAAASGEADGVTAGALVLRSAARTTENHGAVAQLVEADGSVQQQITRSVGRAANKAADLLSNLPTLPSFRRRKD